MTIGSTILENNDKIAHDVLSFIQENHVSTSNLVLRPFNSYDTAFTEWWLIPSNEWPSYKFGKLCFHKYPRSADGLLYAGFYIEKGLGPKLSGLPDIQAKFIMTQEWFWHTFKTKASDGLVDELINQVCKKANLPVRVLLEIHAFNKVPEPDSERNEPSESLEFEVDLSYKWHLLHAGQDLLSTLDSCQSMGEVVKMLASIDGLQYFWIDLVIGIPLRYGSKEGGGWNSHDIWHKGLQPWLELFTC